MKFVILKNEFDDGYLNWESACNKFNHKFVTIDLTLSNWLEALKKTSNVDGYLACPPGRQAVFKELYDERIYIIEKILNKFVYPSYNEISLHENKKFLSYWLDANDLPHPKTVVLYKKQEALDFIKQTNLPIVAKTNIGASGKGVQVFRNIQNLNDYIENAFGKGVKSTWGPNFKMGNLFGRVINIIKNPGRIKKRLQIYSMVYNEVQKSYCIFQEYIPHDYEWRVVKIGDSFFGHKKIKKEDKASGTKGILYDFPPKKLLDFVDQLCSQYGFNSMAVDLFEDGRGGYLINELQCIFGHVQEYICEKDGKPGRFIKNNSEWTFEEGYFNSNLSYDLRLKNIVELLSKNIV